MKKKLFARAAAACLTVAAVGMLAGCGSRVEINPGTEMQVVDPATL